MTSTTPPKLYKALGYDGYAFIQVPVKPQHTRQDSNGAYRALFEVEPYNLLCEWQDGRYFWSFYDSEFEQRVVCTPAEVDAVRNQLLEGDNSLRECLQALAAKKRRTARQKARQGR